MRSLLAPLALSVALCACGTGTGSPPIVDGGVLPDGGSGSCALPGTWKGNLVAGPFAGQQVTWTFAAGGTSTAGFSTNTVNGTWVVNGATATLTDTSSTPTSIACAAGVTGTYALAYTANCTQLTFSAQTEPCDGRKLAIDQVALTRQ